MTNFNIPVLNKRNVLQNFIRSKVSVQREHKYHPFLSDEQYQCIWGKYSVECVLCNKGLIEILPRGRDRVCAFWKDKVLKRRFVVTVTSCFRDLVSGVPDVNIPIANVSFKHILLTSAITLFRPIKQHSGGCVFNVFCIFTWCRKFRKKLLLHFQIFTFSLYTIDNVQKIVVQILYRYYGNGFTIVKLENFAKI